MLVGTDNPAAVRDAARRSTGLSVLDRDQLARNDLGLMARAYGVPLTVMRAVAFAIGSLVIALTVYTAIVDRRREYGIVKAIGAAGRHLSPLAVHQTMIIAGDRPGAGGLLFLVGRAVITWARPQFVILATTRQHAGAPSPPAVLMGAARRRLPARRLARLEPAVAYRGG